MFWSIGYTLDILIVLPSETSMTGDTKGSIES